MSKNGRINVNFIFVFVIAHVVRAQLLKPLPIDIDDFEKIIKGGYIYVDKTKFISKLIEPTYGGSRFHFLARPRGFGKSLLISTLEALFRNKKALFEGTEIYKSDRKWAEYPVVRIDISTLSCESIDKFEKSLCAALADIAKSYGLPELNGNDTESYVHNLIEGLRGKFSEKVVILIDESDHCFIENYNPSNVSEARKFSKVLASFHQYLEKYKGEDIAFGLTTAVHTIEISIMWSRAFYVANDISEYHYYNEMLGFTEQEVEQYFVGYVEQIAMSRNVTKQEIYGELRSRYRGYEFSTIHDTEKVFNPYTILRYLRAQKANHFWTDSHRPTVSKILQDLIRMHPVEALVYLGNREDNYYTSFFSLGQTHSFSHDNLERFMFQSGYLSIDIPRTRWMQHDRERDHKIKLANMENRESFREQVEKTLNLNAHKLFEIIDTLREHIEKQRMNDFILKMKEYFSITRTANLTFSENMYSKKLRELNRNCTTWDLERKKECFWLNFHTALRLTGMFKTIRREKIQVNNQIEQATVKLARYEGSCFVFKLATCKIDSVEECSALDKAGGLDNCYSRNLNVPIWCIGVQFHPDSGEIIDWNGSKFSRVTKIERHVP